MERRPCVLGVRSCIIPRLSEGWQIISPCPRYPECWADGDLSRPAYDALVCTRLEFHIVCAVDVTAKPILICKERKKKNQSCGCGCCWRWIICSDAQYWLFTRYAIYWYCPTPSFRYQYKPIFAAVGLKLLWLTCIVMPRWHKQTNNLVGGQPSLKPLCCNTSCLLFYFNIVQQTSIVIY